MNTDTAIDEQIRDLVRASLRAAIHGETFSPPFPTSAEKDSPLFSQGGCFVTYKTRGELRGCLGCFESSQPLYLTIAAYANLSATADPRFTHHRLTESELPTVDFEVSVLSPLERCAEPEKITLGKHGIYIRDSFGRSGCFLPQVATETGWSIAEFWGNCCASKAGLPADFWRDRSAQCFTFTAKIITGDFA